MFLTGQACAFFQSLGFAFLLDVKLEERDGTVIPADELNLMQRNRVWWTLFVMCIVASVATLLSIFITEDLKRLNFGKKKEDAAEEDNYKRLDSKTDP